MEVLQPTSPAYDKGAPHCQDGGGQPPLRRKPGHVVMVGLLATIGPGLMVMLADTDAGSVVTAAQSGAAWGYSMLPLEVLLVPVLYLVMELTSRLGLATGKGHARLMAECFGRRWAVASVALLLITTTGALVTELAGLSSVAAMEGVPPGLSVPAAAVFLAFVVRLGTYRRVERVGVLLGLCELAFVVAAVAAHPGIGPLAHSFVATTPVGRPGYLPMVAANIGAVVMPWMVYYQQSAVVDKGWGPPDMRRARTDTAVGAVVTQLVMVAVLVAAGSALAGAGRTGRGRFANLTSVAAISDALTPSLGHVGGRIAFEVGMAGAALVAAIVVSLAAAWAFSDLYGRRGSLNANARRAPLFYGIYFASLALAAAIALLSGAGPEVALAVEVGNALLLPLVLGSLLVLSHRALPAPHRLPPWRVAVTSAVVVASVALNGALAWSALGL